ncbi:hypothetical protein Aperf_G00000059512 [Anoplocephala perfoliata]
MCLLATLSGGFNNLKIDHRKSGSKNVRENSIASQPAASVTAETSFSSPKRNQRSLRERLKKSSMASVEAFRRPNLNKTMRQRTHRLFKGLTPEANNTSNTSSAANEPPAPSIESSNRTLSVITAKSSTPSSTSPISAVSTLSESTSSTKHLEAIGIHMTSLAAVLEALLLGLYNTFARSHVAPSIDSVLPPLASGSVFCGPLDVKGRKEVQDRESLEGLLSNFSNKDPATLLDGRKKVAKSSSSASGEETELNTCNRWRILRQLCRLCTERIGDLTERGRAALCYLGLLLGPRGLREYRLPPTPSYLGTADAVPHCDEYQSSHHHGHRSRWRRLGKQHQIHRKPRTSTPVRESLSKYEGGRIDLARITAPLRSAKGKQRRKLSVESRFTASGPHDHIGVPTLGREATAAASMLSKEAGKNSEGKELFAMNGNLLDVPDSENADINISTASRSPTASTHQATSSCTSSDVSSNSDNISSAVSSNDEEEEDNFHSTFIALNEVEEDEEEEVEDREEEEEESSEHPMTGKCDQCVTNEPHSLEKSKPDTEDTFQNALSTLDQCDAMPEYELAVVNDIDEDIVSAKSSLDASLPSLNEQPSFLNENRLSTQQQVDLKSKHSQTLRKSEGEERKHKKSKRPRFHLRSPSVVSEGAIGVTVASTRIPQLPSYFVIELLPSLHFILSTVQSHFAVSAINSLVQRANLELWSNVLLYTNSICNSMLYYDAVDKMKATVFNRTASSNYEQINQSNPTEGRPLSPAGSVVSSGSSRASSTLIRDDEEKEGEPPTVVEVPSLNRSHREAPITNASFQVVRPEEDIPLVTDKAAERASSTVYIDTRQRAKSVSPRHEIIPPAMDASRDLTGFYCGDLCGTGKTSQYHRTLSFNPRLCSALRSSSPKSPSNLKVTFDDESLAAGKGDQVASESLSPPSHWI